MIRPGCLNGLRRFAPFPSSHIASCKMAPLQARKNDAELPIPPAGDMLVLAIVYSIILASFGLAGFNLWHMQSNSNTATMVSIAWPIFVLACLLIAVWEDGCRFFLVKRLGEFSRDHFLYLRTSPVTEEVEVCVGYRLWGKTFDLLRVNRDDVVSVDWRPGQGSVNNQLDLDDWHVALWYHPSLGKKRKPSPGARDDDVFVIGPSGARNEIAAFAQSVIALLAEAEIEMIPGGRDNEFVVKSVASPWGDQGSS